MLKLNVLRILKKKAERKGKKINVEYTVKISLEEWGQKDKKKDLKGKDKINAVLK